MTPFLSCFHMPVCFTYVFQNLVKRSYNQPRYEWHKGNFRAINAKLREVDWDLLFAHLTLEEMYVEFMKSIEEATHGHIQYKKVASTKPLWKTKPPANIKHNRGSA